MDEELKKTLENINKAIADVTAKMSTEGKNEKEIGEIRAELENTKKALQEQSQRQLAFSVSGVDKTLSAGAYFKAHHARAVAGVQKIALDRVPGYAGEDKEIGEQMVTKSAAYGDDASGGFFVPTSMLPGFVDTLRPNERILLDYGAKMTDLPAGSGNMQMPYKTANTSVSQTSENGAPYESNLKWKMLTLSPKRTTGLGSVSNRLTFAAPDYVNIVAADALKTIMLKIQYLCLYGQGTNGEPLGLKNNPDAVIYPLAQAGKVLRATDFAKFEEQLALQNAVVEGSSFVTRPEVIRGMKTERTPVYSGQTGGLPTLNFALTGGMIPDAKLKEDIGGYAFSRLTDVVGGQKSPDGSTSTDCTDGFFGDFSQFQIYTWGGIKFKYSSEATIGSVSAFANDILWIMADVNWDLLVKQPKQILVATGLKTTIVTGE